MSRIILPEVRIEFSYLIYNSIAKPLWAHYCPDKEIMSPIRAQEVLVEYKQAWQLHEQAIMNGMCELFGLCFYKSTQDIYLSPGAPTFSTPTIITMKYDADEFIDVLAHELLHVLITDNTTYNSDEKLGDVIAKLYPDCSRLTRNHILVHAGLKHLYLNVLQEPRRLARDIKNCKKLPDYAKAWEIVEARGYQELIDEFKGRYSEMVEAP
jgi:hypothetical protein